MERAKQENWPRKGNRSILTDAEVLVPHGVQPDDGPAQLLLQLVEAHVDLELDVRVDGQVVGERAQVGDALLVAGVAAAADQDQPDLGKKGQRRVGYNDLRELL